MKKILLTALSLVLVAALAIGGTLAYLTDREGKTNVFTVGNVDIKLNEDFVQGAQLVPGESIEKNVTVTNTGKNDAWVWVEITVPAELQSVIALKQSGAEWKVEGNVAKLSAPLAAGETTASVLEEVAFAASVDITPEGDLYTVVNGVTADLGWNIKDLPEIVVRAYAIQVNDFNSVDDAYAAYGAQWGDNGVADVEDVKVTEAATADELADALANGGVVVLTRDIELDAVIGSNGKATHAMTVAKGSSATINLNGHTINATLPDNATAQNESVFIVNQDFIIEMLKIFENPNIGMMGMVGSPKMPKDGIMWSDERIGGVYACSIKESGEAWAGYVPEPYEKVEAIDGLLMATQYDLEWREDLFEGWDFYDVSQSMEFRRRGYDVVVPQQKRLWCIHDDGYINLEKYFGWRDVFLKEYGDMLHE